MLAQNVAMVFNWNLKVSTVCKSRLCGFATEKTKLQTVTEFGVSFKFKSMEINLPGNIQTIDWRLVVAIVALLVSLGSFAFNVYINHFKKASIKAVLGDLFTIIYGPNKEFVFGIPITLFNNGARFGAVISIRGVIYRTDSPDEKTRIQWRSFYESKDISSSADEFKPHWSFKSWPTTIIVDGHSAENENIKFKTDTPFLVKPGQYAIELTFWNQDMESIGSIKETFYLNEKNCDFLEKECITNEKRITNNSLVITRNFSKN